MQDPLTHPEVVHDLNSLLVLDGNVHGDVVVETRADGELLWQRGPVVLTACGWRKGQRSKDNMGKWTFDPFGHANCKKDTSNLFEFLEKGFG